jgi:hypothetical protein
MIKDCIHSHKILAYLDGELPASERREFEMHLRTCQICQPAMLEFRLLKQNFERRRRPRPSKTFLNQYHQNLASIFSREKKTAPLSWLLYFLVMPKPAVRLARVIVILMVGVSLGWFFSRRTASTVRSASPGLQLSSEAVRQINNYFHQSEIWLLDVMNLSKNGDVDSDEWNLTRDDAQRLLRKTMVIRELAFVDDPRLSGYFNDLEMLLMELINSPEVDRSEMLKEIRQTISELNLQLRTGVLQEKMTVS